MTGRDGSGRVGVVAARFADPIERDRLAVPLPGRGHTAQRWRALAEMAADDLDLGRLAEAHLDALAILAELHGPASSQSPPLPVQRSDLIVYLRHSHAERDLAALGDLAAAADSWQSW
ncbi:MAG: hypothetical protein ACRDRO_17315 [Pseudonocardiaceae bacterium]